MQYLKKERAKEGRVQQSVRTWERLEFLLLTSVDFDVRMTCLTNDPRSFILVVTFSFNLLFVS